MGFAQIESEIKRLANKARDGKITIDEMMVFTITNGGVFGSCFHPIQIHQSAILGMHNIVERPIVVEGKLSLDQ